MSSDQAPNHRVVKTWKDLRDEVKGLRDFYKDALAAAEDLVVAADLADEKLLTAVLAKHSQLKGHGAFRVSNDLFNGKADDKYVH